MFSPFKSLLVSMALLVSGCAASRANKSPISRISVNPNAPRRGEPINSVDLIYYLQTASSNLLQQGRIGTNLLRQAQNKTCRLQLASPPARPLVPAELTDKLEMAVGVVRRVVKARGVAYLNDTATGFLFPSRVRSSPAGTWPGGINSSG
jgi:hypothetical protein